MRYKAHIADYTYCTTHGIFHQFHLDSSQSHHKGSAMADRSL